MNGTSRPEPPPSAGPPPPASRGLPPACARLGDLGEARRRLALGELAEAWDAACQAVAVRPFHPEAALLLASLSEAAGDLERRDACLAHASRMAPGLTSRPRPPVRRIPWSPAVLPPMPPAWAPERLAAPRLSVCMIVRNEERFLAQCLRSVRDLAHQWIIVDTGSTDATIEIARAHGARVYDFPWCDDFAAARNAGLGHATGDWVLVLDADEELPPDQHAALRRLLKVPPVLSWRLPIRDAGRESEGGTFVPRLFRNAPGAAFVGRVHEQAFSSLESSRRAWGLESRVGDAVLRHHGYTAELTRSRAKVDRNLRLLERAILEQPGHAVLLMNLGLELVRSGRPEEGLARYREAFEAMSRESPEHRVPEAVEMLLDQFTSRLMAAGRFEEVVAALTSPLGNSLTPTPVLQFTLGLAEMQLKRFADAAPRMRHCLDRQSQGASLDPARLTRGSGPRHCLALCLWETGDAESAEREFLQARAENPSSLPLRQDFARFLHAHGRSAEALHELHDLANSAPQAVGPWLVGGTIALARPGFLEVALDWTEAARLRFPNHPGVLGQRAEALLLRGRLVEAQPLWRRLAEGPDPRAGAAAILCTAALGQPLPTLAPGTRPALEQEFLAWFRRLIDFAALSVVQRLGDRLDDLARGLPRAASVVRAVFTQVAEGSEGSDAAPLPPPPQPPP